MTVLFHSPARPEDGGGLNVCIGRLKLNCGNTGARLTVGQVVGERNISSSHARTAENAEVQQEPGLGTGWKPVLPIR